MLCGFLCCPKCCGTYLLEHMYTESFPGFQKAFYPHWSSGACHIKIPTGCFPWQGKRCNLPEKTGSETNMLGSQALKRIYPEGYPGAKMAASHEQRTHMAALKANMAKIPGCATSLLKKTRNGQILVATSQRVALEPKQLTSTKLQTCHLFQNTTSQMARCLWIKNYLVMTACLNDFTSWAT